MPGADEIPPEVLKFCDFDEIIISFVNKLLINNENPQKWSDVDIKPLPKTGDLGLITNYRGIALSAVAAKMVNKMLLLRIQPNLILIYGQIRMDSVQSDLPLRIY